MSVRIHTDLLDAWAEMLAASKAVRAFLEVPNNQQKASNAIYRLIANESKVSVASVSPGVAGAAAFVVTGDHTRQFIPGGHCRFVDNLNYRGNLTIAESAYADGATTVTVQEALSELDAAGLKVKPQSCPRIVVWAEQATANKNSQSRGDYHFSAGQLVAVLEWEPDSTYYAPNSDGSEGVDDPQGAGREFGQHVDDVVCDLQMMAGSTRAGASGTTWIDFQTITLTAGPEEIWQPEKNPTGLPMWAARIDCSIGGE